MSIRENPPRFIQTERQLHYYEALYDKLEENGVAITSQDTHSLGMFAMNLAIVEECAESIAENGMMMEVQGDRYMITKVNPAVTMQKEAQTAIRFYVKEFQMSPNSRGNGLIVPPSGIGANDGFDKV